MAVTGLRKGKGRDKPEGSMQLTQKAAEHLCAAIEQMDLLLHSQQADTAMHNLVSLLQHLRAVRCTIS